MPRYIQMLGEDQLPEGPRRDLVARLQDYYEKAGLRPVQEISAKCQELTEKDERLRGTASRETVRRMLNGSSVLTSVPHWENVELVYRALCDFAGQDPDASYEWHHGYDSGTAKYLDDLREAWSAARKAPPVEPQKPQSGGWGTLADPWRNGEPPF
ncbi:hypothetical protein [Streptacidiphilus neutrinimicus]|uniref:hypothetical protein n=1 Tax=Streptacidiphilus neutrinimicus TaxID=105420 RepID=UPI0005A7EC17|nr:hypothetical protein [Streptacidiphilus neutrinimicus]